MFYSGSVERHISYNFSGYITSEQEQARMIVCSTVQNCVVSAEH